MCNTLRMISIILIAAFFILPVSGGPIIGPPGSGKPSPSSTSGSSDIQITKSINYNTGGQSFGGASAYSGSSINIPTPMTPPELNSQEAASATGTRLITYPGIEIYNNFYVSNPPTTVISCVLGQEVPLFLDLGRNGNLYSYEWYPNGKLDAQNLGNIAYSGRIKQSFYGDSRGWHILQYYCNGWSNYIYIRVL